MRSPMIQRFTHPRKRSPVRGVIASLVLHYASVAILITLYLSLRNVIWSTAFGAQYVSSAGPVNPNSVEGTILQVIGLLTWVLPGAAALHWSGDRSFWALAVVAVYLVLLELLGVLVPELNPLPDMPLGRAVWYWSSGPLGFAAGAFGYLSRSGRFGKFPFGRSTGLAPRDA